MATVLQSHHLLEKAAFENDLLLKALVESNLIERDSSLNRIYMPQADDFAKEIGMSPHRGRTDSSYSRGINQELRRILAEVGGESILDDAVGPTVVGQ
ncbi:AHH domain-containing protein [Stenotrophomonas sp.]|uniref:AHH domain-containing protein n=1 Tax=Stenotrophomonas sp. TaxID=69392 RepID=UPI0028AC81AD|nr:AHH domain-containing protein [Stenotrophomonas sp.]